MQVRCKNLACKKVSTVSDDWVACPYCGDKFSSYGINVKELVAEERAAFMYGNIWVLMVPIGFIATVMGVWGYIYSYQREWLKANLSGALACFVFCSLMGFSVVIAATDFLRRKAAAKKFPRVFKQPDF